MCAIDTAGEAGVAGEPCPATRVVGLFLPPEEFAGRLGVGSCGLLVANP